jgi:hypothetical protein
MSNQKYNIQSRMDLKERVRETINNFVNEYFDDKKSFEAKRLIRDAFKRFNLEDHDKR